MTGQPGPVGGPGNGEHPGDDRGPAVDAPIPRRQGRPTRPEPEPPTRPRRRGSQTLLRSDSTVVPRAIAAAITVIGQNTVLTQALRNPGLGIFGSTVQRRPPLTPWQRFLIGRRHRKHLSTPPGGAQRSSMRLGPSRATTHSRRGANSTVHNRSVADGTARRIRSGRKQISRLARRQMIRSSWRSQRQRLLRQSESRRQRNGGRNASPGTRHQRYGYPRLRRRNFGRARGSRVSPGERNRRDSRGVN